MSISALVIGYGSIGKRHAELLNEMSEISHVKILSNQSGLPFETIKSLEEIPGLNPDYIIISSITALHYEQLAFLEKNLKGKKILVEKPLFDAFKDLEVKNNQVFVGYTLRCHPLLRLIREKIVNKEIWSANIFCGGYLPEWYTKKDYRKSYSASKKAGGGVLLDISHELDYINWLCGRIEPEFTKNKKISNLEIDSDDFLLLSGYTERDVHVNISLNYFTRKSVRQIIIDGEGISLNADLLRNTITIHDDGISSDYSWPNFSKNDMYITQHKELLLNETFWLCNYEEGQETMRLIEKIRSYSKQ